MRRPQRWVSAMRTTQSVNAQLSFYEVTGRMAADPESHVRAEHRTSATPAVSRFCHELKRLMTQKSQSMTNHASTRGGHMEPVASSSSAPAEYHAVRFYESDGALARIVAEFLHAGLDRESPGIVVATSSVRGEIIRELTNRSMDVVELQRSHDLLLLDARETLSTFMEDGRPDARKFKDQMCQVIHRVSGDRTDCTVRIFGQMVDVLWQDGERDAAIRLEVLWNQLARTEAFSLLCGYAMGIFTRTPTSTRSAASIHTQSPQTARRIA